jgi:putative copper export protein
VTFLGAAIAAAGFLLGPLVVGRNESADPSHRPRFLLALVGAVTGLLATLAEPLLQTRFPPAGLARPSVSEAFDALPSAWLLRAPALGLAALLAFWLLARARAERNPAANIAGAALCLAAIAGLALTSHASARDSWRVLAVAAVLIHQWAVALWTGGLVQLIGARPFDRDGERPMPIQRFSFYALFLALAGIATGIVNAGLVLPRLAALWESDYGKVLIVKIAVLVPVLALAAYHRLTLRRALERAAGALQTTLRAEAQLAMVVVLFGSILALLAPPSKASLGVATTVDLAAPLTADLAGPYVRFVINPAESGENDLTVSLTNGPPRSFNEEGQFVDAPILTDVALVRVGLTSLLENAAPYETDLTGDATGLFRASGVVLGLDGWWRADVLVRRLGVEDATVPFYFMLPDPNVHGMNIALPDAEPDGQFLFQRAMEGMTNWDSVHFVERLAGGTGMVVVTDHAVRSGTDDTAAAAMRIASATSEMIRAQGKQWVREAGGEWRVTDAPDVILPSAWVSTYEGATGFRLGATAQVGGRETQIVTFVVPGERIATAWYAWWVDLETGDLLRETMVSVGHYMLREFDSFDAVPPIALPEA